MSRHEAGARAAAFGRLHRAMAERDPTWRPAEGWFVPGRIEVLGKHTDYAGGRSLLCATERGFSVVDRPRQDSAVVMTDIGRQSTITLHMDPNAPAPGVPWAKYPLTVVRRVARNFPEARRGVDIVFESDLPGSSGLSTSSALIVASLLAIASANELESHPSWIHAVPDVEALAGYAGAIENGSAYGRLDGDAGVGTSGGSEDHTAILCATPGSLTQYAFCPIRREHSVELGPSLIFAIAFCGVAASKTGGARARYNRAASGVAAVLTRWRSETGRRDETLAAAVESTPDAAAHIDRLLAAEPESGILRNRVLQFVEESTVLVPEATRCLSRGDLRGFGARVARSQALAEDWLGNQVPETSALVRSALELGAHAASAFGAGFGGSVWALVERSDGDGFLGLWAARYRDTCPQAAARAAFFLTRPGPPALRVW